jgi:hypothetical protein
VRIWLCETTERSTHSLFCRSGLDALPKLALSAKPEVWLSEESKQIVERERAQLAMNLMRWKNPIAYEEIEAARREDARELVNAVGPALTSASRAPRSPALPRRVRKRAGNHE